MAPQDVATAKDGECSLVDGSFIPVQGASSQTEELKNISTSQKAEQMDTTTSEHKKNSEDTEVDDKDVISSENEESTSEILESDIATITNEESPQIGSQESQGQSELLAMLLDDSGTSKQELHRRELEHSIQYVDPSSLVRVQYTLLRENLFAFHQEWQLRFEIQRLHNVPIPQTLIPCACDQNLLVEFITNPWEFRNRPLLPYERKIGGISRRIKPKPRILKATLKKNFARKREEFLLAHEQHLFQQHIDQINYELQLRESVIQRHISAVSTGHVIHHYPTDFAHSSVTDSLVDGQVIPFEPQLHRAGTHYDLSTLASAICDEGRASVAHKRPSPSSRSCNQEVINASQETARILTEVDETPSHDDEPPCKKRRFSTNISRKPSSTKKRRRGVVNKIRKGAKAIMLSCSSVIRDLLLFFLLHSLCELL